MRKPKSKNRVVVTIVAILCAMWLVSSLTGGAEAADHGQIGTISPSNPVMEQSYPKIQGVYPPNCSDPSTKGGCSFFFATVRQETCKDSAYCDVISWRVDLPDFYPEIHSVKVSLSWPDAPPANDMDLWLWQDDVNSDQANCCLGPAWASSTTQDRHPETLTLGEPQGDDPDTEDFDEGEYWATVVNYSGVNSGYTLKFEWLLLDLGPEYTREERTFRGGGAGAGGAAGGSGRPSSGLGSGSGTDDARPETFELIKIPGDDGTLTEQELSTLLAAQEERQRRTNPLIPATIAVLGLGFALAAFFFFWKRKKRLDEEALLP